MIMDMAGVTESRTTEEEVAELGRRCTYENGTLGQTRLSKVPRYFGSPAFDLSNIRTVL